MRQKKIKRTSQSLCCGSLLVNLLNALYKVVANMFDTISVIW